MVASFIDFGSDLVFLDLDLVLLRTLGLLVFLTFWIWFFGLLDFLVSLDFWTWIFQTLDCDPSNQSIDNTNVMLIRSRHKSTNAVF